jgi:Tfp pilus assembly protein PilV
MSRRKGLTLMEVLAAIFVMAIGLLSILAMFPMGALTMQVAINSDRAAHAVANARSVGTAMNLRQDGNLAGYFKNPSGTAGAGGFTDAPPDGASYAVFADPIGALSYSAGYNNWVAGKNSSMIPRTQTFFTKGATASQSYTQTLRWCTLLDDVSFANNARADLASGVVNRTNGVSWAWLLRRPKSGDPSCCNMTVVVFNQRAISSAVALSAREVLYPQCTVDPNQMTSVTLAWNAGTPTPPVRFGGWVMDATPNVDQNTGIQRNGPGMAKFYRVVSMGDVFPPAPGTGFNTMNIELAQPLQQALQPDGKTPLQYRTIVVIDNVVEVLECGSGWKPGA